MVDPLAIRLDLEGGAVLSPGAGAESKPGFGPLFSASLSLMLLAL
jgi:hypothetical protein